MDLFGNAITGIAVLTLLPEVIEWLRRNSKNSGWNT